jgi:hypothetical protein
MTTNKGAIKNNKRHLIGISYQYPKIKVGLAKI